MTKPSEFDLQPTLVGESITLLPLHADDFESRYYDWHPVTQEVAIGFTFLTREHRVVSHRQVQCAFTQGPGKNRRPVLPRGVA